MAARWDWDRAVSEVEGGLVEQITDLTSMASAMARENGETDIARALDTALMKIGFRIAALMKRAAAGQAPAVPLPSGDLVRA